MTLSRGDFEFLARFRNSPVDVKDRDSKVDELVDAGFLVWSYNTIPNPNPNVTINGLVGKVPVGYRISITDKGLNTLIEHDRDVKEATRQERKATTWNVVIVVIASLTLVATVIGIFAALGWLS